MNGFGLRGLLSLTVLVFLMGEGAVFAEPLAGIPGRDFSATFLERCIMETSLSITLNNVTRCPSHFSCQPGEKACGMNALEPPMLAGMVGIPFQELDVMPGAGGRTENTAPLLIMGIVFISLSNIIRLSGGRQNQQTSPRYRAEKAVAADS